MKPQSQQTTASVKKPTTEYALYMHREELRRRKLHFQRIFHTKIQLTHELITRRQRNIGYCSFEDLQIINREKAFQQNLQRNLYQRRQQIQQAVQVQRHEMMQKHKQHIMQKHQQSVIQQQQRQQQQHQSESKGCQQLAKIPKLSFAPMLYTQQQPSVQQQQQRVAILPMQHSIVQIAGPVIIQNVQFVQQQQHQQQPQQRQQQQQQPFHHQQLMNQKLVVQNQLLMHKHQQAKQLPQRYLLSLKLKPLKRLQK